MVSTTSQQQPSQSPGFRRSEIATRLAATGYAPLQNIRGEAQGDVLILTGTVPSYYLKQVAQTVAGNLNGVNRVENRLEVRSPR